MIASFLVGPRRRRRCCDDRYQAYSRPHGNATSAKRDAIGIGPGYDWTRRRQPRCSPHAFAAIGFPKLEEKGRRDGEKAQAA
jgi:hypothetical protein